MKTAMLFPLLAASAAAAFAADDPRIDAIFEKWSKPGSPGAAVAVVANGDIAYLHGYGTADLEHDVPIGPSTPFHVASVSKQFTAFAVLLLERRGKLSLDDDVRRHLPELPDYGKPVLVRHLLNHTSGIRDQWDLLVMAGWRMDDVITRAQILKTVFRQKALNFPPGTEWLYCNSGYTLAAEIAARVSGKPFPQLAAEEIFRPLGMGRTHFHDDHEMLVPGRAYSYRRSGDGFKLCALNYANAGATSLFTTAEDLAKWMLNFQDPKVGDAALIARLVERGRLDGGRPIDYGCGVANGEYRGLAIIEHGGADAGFRSHILMVPAERFGVAILGNEAAMSPDRLARKVVDVCLAARLKPAGAKPAVPEGKEVAVDRTVLDLYAGKYQLFPGFVLDIARDGDHLTVQATGQPRFTLFAESETSFFLKAAEAHLTFARPASGPAMEVTLRQNGERVARRIVGSGTMSPADYAGTYRSDELLTEYRIEVRDGKLVARHQRHDDIRLEHASGDDFTGSGEGLGLVRFFRGADGRVAGLRLSSGRIRGLEFLRTGQPPLKSKRV